MTPPPQKKYIITVYLSLDLLVITTFISITAYQCIMQPYWVPIFFLHHTLFLTFILCKM